VSIGAAKRLRRGETATMTRILTVSSGRATPNSECSACATQGFSGAAKIDRKGARKIPYSEMLAAPNTNAVQTLAGGPGRSSAATTSHNISSAGATAAVPMTVGRDSRMSIEAANILFFPVIHRSNPMRREHRHQSFSNPGRYSSTAHSSARLPR